VTTAAGKRALDVIVAAALLVLLAPLLVLVALLVRLGSPGPALFRAERAGRGGRPFFMLKIRTMRSEAHAGGAITAPGDARITRLGAWLRLFKIDELPQLVNVLRGDMSLVGPRPQDPRIVREYYTEAQRRVLDVRPGITGLGQVTFFPDMTADVPPGRDTEEYYRDVQLPQKLAVDLDYVDRASLGLDLRLLLRTAFCVLVKSWWILVTRPPLEMKRRA
jgi:lipopolysaccharide/colanic/teichoic acid biosynthesis glycosyltransferase